MNDFIGKSLNTSAVGTLELTSLLGTGSFAQVYHAKSIKETSTAYAVKVLFKSNLTEKQIEIQRQEYLLHQKVSSHPNIVTLYSVEEDDECIYLVLEHWSHGDLFDALVDDTNAYTSLQDQAFDLFLQIADAVKYCHDNNVFHRDLKPENILLSKQAGYGGQPIWRAALSDFGLATDTETSSEFGCGSVRYMSPECLQESTPYSTPANDIWSLGVILINLYSNKNPWCEPTSSDPMYNDFLQDKTNFFLKHFGVSDEMDSILQGCFELDQDCRLDINNLHESFYSFAIHSAQDGKADHDEEQALVVPDVKRSFSTKSWGSDVESDMDFTTEVPVPSFYVNKESSSPTTTPTKKTIKNRKKRRQQRKKKKTTTTSTTTATPPPSTSASSENLVDLANLSPSLLTTALTLTKQQQQGAASSEGLLSEELLKKLQVTFKGVFDTNSALQGLQQIRVVVFAAYSF